MTAAIVRSKDVPLIINALGQDTNSRIVAGEIPAEVVRATRLWIAVDCGRVINPDGVANQIEGGAIQATSWALREAVTWDGETLTSTSWEAYPILRFSEVPAVEVAILDGRYPGAVVATVFQAPQRLDDVACDRLLPEDPDDAAHGCNLHSTKGRTPLRT
mgnify:CR=1 FL=1